MKLRTWPGLLIWAVLLTGLTAAGVWVFIPHTTSPASAAPMDQQNLILPTGMISNTPGSPEISVIDSSSPTCSRPAAGTDVCYIGWSYLSVNATPGQYMISMTVGIDGRLRAYYQGFFQGSMYIPGDLMGPGLKVSCGVPGSSGSMNMGKTYPYEIRAKETGGLGATNYGSVSCPADIVSLADLSVAGPITGRAGETYTYTASVLPITATLPVTYTWTVTGQPTFMVVTDTLATAIFSWANDGDKTVMVSAKNMDSTFSDWLTVTIKTKFPLFLPQVRK